MSTEKLAPVDRFEAPYKRDIKLEAVEHQSGMKMLRMTIREGRRFTVLDIDEKTARHWAAKMTAWADVVAE